MRCILLTTVIAALLAGCANNDTTSPPVERVPVPSADNKDAVREYDKPKPIPEQQYPPPRTNDNLQPGQ